MFFSCVRLTTMSTKKDHKRTNTSYHESSLKRIAGPAGVAAQCLSTQEPSIQSFTKTEQQELGIVVYIPPWTQIDWCIHSFHCHHVNSAEKVKFFPLYISHFLQTVYTLYWNLPLSIYIERFSNQIDAHSLGIDYGNLRYQFSSQKLTIFSFKPWGSHSLSNHWSDL